MTFVFGAFALIAAGMALSSFVGSITIGLMTALDTRADERFRDSEYENAANLMRFSTIMWAIALLAAILFKTVAA